ncbi:MAG TPA: protein kinase [Terracidiphilus sp.]|nr:protein kinase [Terracidiphilus sp.]
MDRKTIGRYEIVDELGRGAMGSVLRARDPAMGRSVALKCIHSAALDGDQKNEFRERFFREARAAGALAHPGIVPVFDVGEDDGIPFLVMELVQGRTLADAMKTGERYPLERVCEIGQQIADALGYAHRNGVVHRDIKPANILMTSREVYGAERPRITDFGVAKLAGGEITSTGQLLGTPAFMAPEQFTGEPVDGRADLFSLGVMLYRMATGEQPFGGETITAVSYKVVHTDPIPPSKLNPAIGSRLGAVLQRCLAKSPADRYQTGDELAADLAAARPGSQATGIYQAPQTPYPGAGPGIDPGATVDMTPPQRTYSGQGAPQWGTMTAGTQNTAGPGMPVPQYPRQPDPATMGPRSTAPGMQTAQPAMQTSGTGIRSNPQAYPQQAPKAPQVVAPAQRTMSPAASMAGPVSQSYPAAKTAAPAPRAAEPAPALAKTFTPSPKPAVATKTASQEDSPMATLSGRKARVVPEEPAKKKGVPILVWIIALAVVALGARYLLQLRLNPNTGEVASDSSASGSSTAGTGSAASAVSANSTQAGAAPANFNPHNLDPGRSGRMRLGFDSVPSAVLLTVQMDGSPYWSGAAGLSTENELVVPQGRHSFRIAVYGGGGTAPILSNSAEADVLLSKSLLMTADLNPHVVTGAGILPPGTKISLAIRTAAM